jgi:glycosyltransferase involved in cell wall biosynthesis
MLISIITINLNNLNGLIKTVDSVFSQDYKEIDYLIIDGGSTDGSVEWMKKNQNLGYRFISESDNGIYNAQNKGGQMALGSYLFFLNSGDVLNSSNVLSALAINAKGDIDLIYGNLITIDYSGLVKSISMPTTFDHDFFIEGTLNQHVCLIKKSLWKRLGGFDEKYKLVSDWVFFYRAILLEKAITYKVDISVVKYNLEGISSRLSARKTMESEKLDFLSQYAIDKIKFFSNNKSVIEMEKPGLLEKLFHKVKLFKRNRNSFKRFKRNFSDINFHEIPIIINSRDRFSYLRLLVKWLEKNDYHNIHIIDNASTYEPLLNYYKEIPYPVYQAGYNAGYCALWDIGSIWNKFSNSYYVYTDSDILPDENCPRDFLEMFYYLLNKYEGVDKVGFSLKIDDLLLPEQNLNKVISWEKQFWKNKIDKYAYHADIDTTFALYRAGSKGPASMTRSLRTAPPYTAQHLPWYGFAFCSPDEAAFYEANANEDTHWGAATNYTKAH